MGSVTSANDEWIELYNSGTSAVSVAGWTLGDGINLSIALSGSIPAGGYAVLERTDDESAPGPAFLIFTGAIPNTGATLRLTRSDGGLEDQVAGGEQWTTIGGDNVTKETAQYTPAGWVTASATPGAANAPSGTAAATAADRDEPMSGSSHVVDARAKKTPPLVLPPAVLSLGIDAPQTTYVGQNVSLVATPSGIADDLLDSVTYEWNFGDTRTGTGAETNHTYAYPGEYVVSLFGSYARHEATTRGKVTVLPVTVGLVRTDTGDIRIENNARYEVDLSGYHLSGTRTVWIPDRTILLPQATLTIASERLGETGSATLFDARGGIAARIERPRAAAPVVATASPVVAAPDPSFSYASDASAEAPGLDTAADLEPETVVESAAVADAPVPRASWPYLGLIGVMTLGIGSLLVRRRAIPVTDQPEIQL
jgi:hypothetical protein